MTHVHKKTGLKFEVGFIKDFDMTVITRWLDEGGVEFIDYYFGEYDKESTDYYIDKYFEKMENLKNGLEFLESQYLINVTDGDYMEKEDVEKLKNSIETIKMIINKES